jgi:O-antigen/teichoic acid export membrane protein
VTAALLLGEPLLALIYGPAYAAHADVFVLVMLAGGLAYVSSFLGYGMTAARFFKAQTPLFLLVVSVTAAGSLLLIPPLGIRGAALALIVSFSVQLTASLLLNLYALRRLGAAT